MPVAAAIILTTTILLSFSVSAVAAEGAELRAEGAVSSAEGPMDTTAMSVEEAAVFKKAFPFSAARKPDQQMNAMDPAELQKRYPLHPQDRSGITVDWLRKLQTQEQLDQVYVRLPSGPIPVGELRGNVIIRRETVQKLSAALDATWMLKKSSFVWSRICGNIGTLECIAEMLWMGKKIYPPDQAGEYFLRNAIAKKVALSLGPLLGGGKFVLEAFKLGTTEKFDGEYKYMQFPAKVHCGQSLLDSRRESIIIDYSHGDDAKPFVPGLDDLAGRNGIYVRDEIRMVHPKLYLGRAYLERIFALNFTLEPVGTLPTSANACYDSLTE